MRKHHQNTEATNFDAQCRICWRFHGAPLLTLIRRPICIVVNAKLDLMLTSEQRHNTQQRTSAAND